MCTKGHADKIITTLTSTTSTLAFHHCIASALWRWITIRHETGSHFVTQRPSDPRTMWPGDPVDPVTHVIEPAFIFARLLYDTVMQAYWLCVWVCETEVACLFGSNLGHNDDPGPGDPDWKDDPNDPLTRRPSDPVPCLDWVRSTGLLQATANCSCCCCCSQAVRRRRRVAKIPSSDFLSSRNGHVMLQLALGKSMRCSQSINNQSRDTGGQWFTSLEIKKT